MKNTLTNRVRWGAHRMVISTIDKMFQLANLIKPTTDCKIGCKNCMLDCETS